MKKVDSIGFAAICRIFQKYLFFIIDGTEGSKSYILQQCLKIKSVQKFCISCLGSTVWAHRVTGLYLVPYIYASYPSAVRKLKKHLRKSLTKFHSEQFDGVMTHPYSFMMLPMIRDLYGNSMNKQIYKIICEPQIDHAIVRRMDKYFYDRCNLPECNAQGVKMQVVCKQCRSTLYCSAEHAKEDRKRHKSFCKNVEKAVLREPEIVFGCLHEFKPFCSPNGYDAL